MCLQENYCYILITYFNKVEKDNCIEISPKYLIRMSKKKILEKGFHQRHQLKITRRTTTSERNKFLQVIASFISKELESK